MKKDCADRWVSEETVFRIPAFESGAESRSYNAVQGKILMALRHSHYQNAVGYLKSVKLINLPTTLNLVEDVQAKVVPFKQSCKKQVLQTSRDSDNLPLAASSFVHLQLGVVKTARQWISKLLVAMRRWKKTPLVAGSRRDDITQMKQRKTI